MNLAVIGATGLVGGKLLSLLEERGVDVGELHLYASDKSKGKLVRWKTGEYGVEELTPAILNLNLDFVFIATGNDISEEYSPKLSGKGVTVIDKSSRWRLTDGVPLVVPEVNFSDIGKENKLIANPNCSTIQLVVAMNPVFGAFGLKKMTVSTYQAVSGIGKAAVEEYDKQLRDVAEGKTPVAETLDFPIVGNCIPHCDKLTTEGEFAGYMQEERKLILETRKILHAPDLDIDVTAVRVPVRNCHSEAVFFETERATSVAELREMWKAAPGVKLLDEPENHLYPMPYYLDDSDDIFVGRIRKSPSRDNCFSCWVVGDNLRKGAATNALQIMLRLREVS